MNMSLECSENEIVKSAQPADLRPDLLARARRMAVINNKDHPWKDLDDPALLKNAALYKKDYKTGEEGITLAGILLLGTDEIIHAVVPHYKTDLIFRGREFDWNEDRDEVRTNLMDSYDRIMAFVIRHLPSPFYLEGTVRYNIRNIIFREIAVNLLVHREYSDPYPACFVIERDRIFTENANQPYFHGKIGPKTDTPYPKNPTIARFFRQIGFAYDMGAGVRKISRYAGAYAGSQPVMTDSEIFRLDWKTNLFGYVKDPRGTIISVGD